MLASPAGAGERCSNAGDDPASARLLSDRGSLATCVAVDDDLTGWWPGDCGAIDLAGSSDGTLQGGAVVLPGQVGTAFTLDGIDDYVSIPHDAKFNPTGPFSVDLWMKAPAQSGQVLLVDKSHGFTDGSGWGMQSENDGRVFFFFGTGGGVFDFHGAVTSGSLFDDEWHHVAGVWTGARFEIWVDGELDGTLDFTTTPVNNSRALAIGSAWGGGARTRFFRGALDEVAYTDRALDEKEIVSIYEAGAGRCSPLPCDDGQCVSSGQCRSCGQPSTSGPDPTASDALQVLRTAVGLRDCKLCICDVDSGGSVLASDALSTLRRGVGQPVLLECPAACPATAVDD